MDLDNIEIKRKSKDEGAKVSDSEDLIVIDEADDGNAKRKKISFPWIIILAISNPRMDGMRYLYDVNNCFLE